MIAKKQIKNIDLLEIVEERTKFIVNDCRSFTALKTMSPKIIRLFKKGEIGGGNLVCAIAILSTLEFYSRINYLSEMIDIDTLKSKQKKQELSVYDAVTIVIKLFDQLSADKIELFDPTIDKQDRAKIWKHFRNELVHYLWVVNGGVVAMPPMYLPNKTLNEIENDWLGSTGFIYMFQRINSDTNELEGLSISRAIHVLPKINNWLKSKLAENNKQKNDEILRCLQLGYK